MPKFSVILMAAGKSTRFKGQEKKPFAQLDGRAVWLRSAELFITRKDVVQTQVVIAAEDDEVFRRRHQANLAFMNVKIVHGGAERADSVANALANLAAEAEWVVIHDAVRPCVSSEQIDAVLANAVQHGAAILAVPVADTLKRVNDQFQIEATTPRHGLWQAQTPQVFRKDWIVEAYAQRAKLGKVVTDDAQLVEALGKQVYVVEGAASNLKITTHADLEVAEAILKTRQKAKPAGPIHPFAAEAQW